MCLCKTIWGTNMEPIKWKISREGHAWTPEEAVHRQNLLPEPTKIEMHQGKLFWNDEERLLVVAMLLENLGIDKIIPLFDPDVLFEALVTYEAGEKRLNEILKILDEKRSDR